MREFDLNIERVLEDWTVAHAIREIIANALDEAALTGTREPQIRKDGDGPWHVRDWGRGLEYEHLTQNESAEKQANIDRVIGKFGVGLKDALAVFDRHHVGVRFRSRHSDIETGLRPKHGFDDLRTLHALIADPSDSSFVGTDVVLSGVSDNDVAEAKHLFLKFSGDKVLETTPFGQVLRRRTRSGRIYVNGLRVAEEANYLFSYNITSPTASLRRALNRERTNVGRTAYTDRVKAILLAATTGDVANVLAKDLARFEAGTWHDETQLTDVALHACAVLNAIEKVLFVSSFDAFYARDFIDRARADGHRVIVVPQNIASKLGGMLDIQGKPIVDIGEYRRQWTDSFVFDFVTPDGMTGAEREVFDRTKEILGLRGGRPRGVKRVLVSNTMRLRAEGYTEARGLWDPQTGNIVIKRSELRSLDAYAGTLLHEATHVISDAGDISEEFEDALTVELGRIASSVLTRLSHRTRT